MDEQNGLAAYVKRALESLEPSAADLASHDCAQHPKITHERWLQCQHEIRAILAGTPDPILEAEMAAERRRYERRIEEVRRFWER